VYWELTSCKLPFGYETKKNDLGIMLEILNGKRENPIPNTNSKFVALYQSEYKIMRSNVFLELVFFLFSAFSYRF
jgi:hypothetical protein